MDRKRLVLAAALVLALPLSAPGGGAHTDPVPLPPGYPCGPAQEHHYTTGASLHVDFGVSASWRTTVALLDSCLASDGEGDYGLGGGFLPSDHHGVHHPGIWEAFVCVFDDVFGSNTEFVVGINVGGGIISHVAHGQGCTFVSLPTPFTVGGLPAPGADGGVWVFLENAVDASGNVAVPVNGHIYGF